MYGVSIPEPSRSDDEPSYEHRFFAAKPRNPHNAYRYTAKELRKMPLADCACGLDGCTGKKLATPPPPPPYRVML